MKEIITEQISSEQYAEAFEGKENEPLKQALDIRKFEIELYWKRVTYFWAFIGATMAGFLAVQATVASNKQDLAVILSCLAVLFSFGWVCVNRGRKYWQENWVKDVDVLEDKVTGRFTKWCYPGTRLRNSEKRLFNSLMVHLQSQCRKSMK